MIFNQKKVKKNHLIYCQVKKKMYFCRPKKKEF